MLFNTHRAQTDTRNPLHSSQLMCLGADLEGTPVGWERSLNPKCFEIKEDLRVALMDLSQASAQAGTARGRKSPLQLCCRML